MAKTNPLDQYVTTKPGSWARDLKVPTFPSLRQAMSGKNNLLDGLKAIDNAIEVWRKAHEQALSERLRQQEPSTTTTVVQQAAASAPADTGSSAASVDLTSINDAITAINDQITLILASIASAASTTQLGTDNVIPMGVVKSVPVGWSLVIAGPMVIDGVLTIDGVLLAL